MDISKKTDYALRMIGELIAREDGTLSVRTAAREAGVPYSFARSIQRDLASAGIVTNARGANGGMRLAIDPRMTTLLRLVEAVQGPVMLSSCRNADGDGAECPNRATCRYTSVWCNAERMLRSFLSSVTLHELVVEGRCPVPRVSFELVDEAEARALAEGAGA